MPHHPVQCGFFLDEVATMPCPHVAVGIVLIPEWNAYIPCCAHCGVEKQWSIAPGQNTPIPEQEAV